MAVPRFCHRYSSTIITTEIFTNVCHVRNRYSFSRWLGQWFEMIHISHEGPSGTLCAFHWHYANDQIKPINTVGFSLVNVKTDLAGNIWTIKGIRLHSMRCPTSVFSSKLTKATSCQNKTNLIESDKIHVVCCKVYWLRKIWYKPHYD